MLGRLNLCKRNGGGGGGGEVELNVFAQSIEPATKDGIWINTSATGSLPGIDKFEYEGVNILNYDAYTTGLNPLCCKLGDIPYNFYRGSAVAIGTDIYLLGTDEPISPISQRYTYKYDTLTHKYTKLGNIPYNFYSGSAVAIGTDIYLFGSGNTSYKKYAYKYNTLTDEYTKLGDIPYNFYEGSAVTIGTDIYLFGSAYTSATQKYAYKYNTLTGVRTKLGDNPYNFYGGSAVAVGTDIYLFGSGDTSCKRYAYKVIHNYVLGNNVYLFSLLGIFKIKLTENISIPIYYAAIAQNNTLKKYPAYYGDGTQWNRLPT